MMRQAIGVAVAFLAFTKTVTAQECYICPGGSLRDYWILQMEVIKACDRIVFYGM